MNELRRQDLHFVVTRIPRDVREMVRDNALFIAGGFIRSTISDEKPSDIDIFGPNKDELETIAMQFALSRTAKLHSTDNAFTVLSGTRIPVQFIHRWLYPSDQPDLLLREFDFTIAQAVVWFADNQWHSLISDDFYADLAARRLVYTHPKRLEDAGGSLLRVRKFVSKGYSIQPLSLAGVVARLFMAVREQRGEWSEEFVTQVLCGLLREVDPLQIVDGVELINEHEAAA